MRSETYLVPQPSTDVPIDVVQAKSRLIRLPEVIKRVGLSRSAIYKRMSEGKFPRSRSLGPKCAVWVEAEIDAWITQVTETVYNSD
jgi:prophage regulatory protein